MALCIKCFKRETAISFAKKKVKRIEHKHPANVKYIVCSSCMQKILTGETPAGKIKNLWEINLSLE